MPRYWTHLWTTKTCKQLRGLTGRPFDNTADNRLGKVEPGDYVYGVKVQGGTMHVIGRLCVGRVLTQDEARARYGAGAWPADHHVIAKRGETTAVDFNRTVPLEVARQIQFFVKNGDVARLEFEAPGKVHRQTLRGVRELTPQSAALLDDVLGE